jgi:hypothetical protein
MLPRVVEEERDARVDAAFFVDGERHLGFSLTVSISRRYKWPATIARSSPVIIDGFPYYQPAIWRKNGVYRSPLHVSSLRRNLTCVV